MARQRREHHRRHRTDLHPGRRPGGQTLDRHRHQVRLHHLNGPARPPRPSRPATPRPTPTPVLSGTPKVGVPFVPPSGLGRRRRADLPVAANGTNITGATGGRFTPTADPARPDADPHRDRHQARVSRRSPAPAPPVPRSRPAPRPCSRPRASPAPRAPGRPSPASRAPGTPAPPGPTSGTPTARDRRRHRHDVHADGRPDRPGAHLRGHQHPAGYTTVTKTSAAKTDRGAGPDPDADPDRSRGTPQIGETLTGDPAPGTTAPRSFQWFADGTPIAGATASPSTLAAVELGVITFTVTSTKDRLRDRHRGPASPPGRSPRRPGVAPRCRRSPAPPRSAAPLTACRARGTTATTLAYQWFADGYAARRCRPGTTYTPGAGKLGAVITVAVTGTRAGYATVTQDQRPHRGRSPRAPDQHADADDHGHPEVGVELTAAPGTWDDGRRWPTSGSPTARRSTAPPARRSPRPERAGHGDHLRGDRHQAGLRPRHEDQRPDRRGGRGDLTEHADADDLRYPEGGPSPLSAVSGHLGRRGRARVPVAGRRHARGGRHRHDVHAGRPPARRRDHRRGHRGEGGLRPVTKTSAADREVAAAT